MKTNFFAVLAAAFLLGACSNNDTENPNGEVPAVFTTNLDQRVQTRAHDAVWDDNDNIGIFSLNDEFGAAVGTTPNMAVNAKYTRQSDDSWTSANLYRFKNPVNTEVKFKAYYPWVDDNAITDGTSGKIDGSIAVDATSQDAAGQKNCDFLFASKESDQSGAADSYGSKDAPSVKFQFAHSMAKVILVFKPEESKGVAFDAAFKAMLPTLSGLKAAGTFSLEDGSVTASGGATDLELKNSAADESGKTMTFVAIVPPQTAASDDTAPEISIGIGGDTYRSVKILGGQAMEAGKYYKYIITVKKMELIISASNISDWTDGLGGNPGAGDAVLQ